MWGTKPEDEIGRRHRNCWTRSGNGIANEILKFRDILSNLRYVSCEPVGIPVKQAPSLRELRKAHSISSDVHRRAQPVPLFARLARTNARSVDMNLASIDATSLTGSIF